MELLELQSKLLEDTRKLDKLGKQIDRLPECEAKIKMEKQMDVIVAQIAILGNLKDNIALAACDFGFTDKCPKCVCKDCPEWPKLFNGDIP